VLDVTAHLPGARLRDDDTSLLTADGIKARDLFECLSTTFDHLLARLIAGEPVQLDRR
jgi:hypothetical protein